MEEIKDKWTVIAEFNSEWTTYKKKNYTYDFKDKLFYYDKNSEHDFCGKVSMLEELNEIVNNSKTVQSCFVYDENSKIVFHFMRK